MKQFAYDLNAYLNAYLTQIFLRWNRVFGNNSLTAPVEEIDFRP